MRKIKFVILAVAVMSLAQVDVFAQCCNKGQADKKGCGSVKVECGSEKKTEQACTEESKKTCDAESKKTCCAKQQK